MEAFARTAKAKKTEVEDVRRPRSLFDFVDHHFRGSETLRRLLAQGRNHGVQTIVIEELEPSIDLEEERADIATAVNSSNIHRSFRLGLFATSIAHKSKIPNVNNQSFIGYVIVRTDLARGKDHPHYIYESVIKKSRRINNFVRGEQEWHCSIYGKDFPVKGYLYAQQNGITTSCAQTSLRTVAAAFQNGKDLSYRTINEQAGIDQISRKGKDGLSSEEMTNILKSLEIGCFRGDFRPESKLTPPAPFERILYSGIESGFPAIVFFKTGKPSTHAIPIFGHTFNEDTWVPSAGRMYFGDVNADCLYSDTWLSMFIGHDDNIGSNVCIPRHYLRSIRQNSHGAASEAGAVSYIISTFPKSAQIYFTKAEATALEMIHTIMRESSRQNTGPWQDPWLIRLNEAVSNQQVVIRPLLINGTDYINHLRHVSDWHDQPVLPDGLLEMEGWVMEGLIWMVEFSLPELFSATKRKIAEVLMKADQGKDVQNVPDIIAARLPGYFALPQSSATSTGSGSFSFIPSGLSKHIEVFGCEGFKPGQS